MFINVNLLEMANIGKRLKELRKKLGLSQLELSQRSSISQASIARIETNQQKNLKSDTLERLSAALGISLSELFEKPEMIAEETPRYGAVRMLPVVTLKEFLSKKLPSRLKESAISFEPVLTQTENAFFLRTTDPLISIPYINKGDLVLIEPTSQIKDGDMVLFISDERTFIGKIFYDPIASIIQPLNRSSKPVIFNIKKRRKNKIQILKISEVRKKT
ncbi:MAG: hypothetical protein A2Y66_08070 [Nitrospirae bacterium RBG_13_41_22]|nr:MAG: hypothetical protein A2Y66_08070 [Nitrospirae bacterium RBG_13_41_22]